jgi:hypothetical protein
MQDGSAMRGRTLALLVAVIVLTPMLLVTSALADLRSPDGTAELGAMLAEDAAVQALVVDAIVDAMITDAIDRSSTVAALAPLVRPLLVRAAQVTLDSPAGRAALAVALADALRQLTMRGPIVIDLRVAAIAAAEEAPPPLDTLARAAVAQGTVGIVVLGDHTEIVAADLAATRDGTGKVGGLPGSVAILLIGALLTLALVGLLSPGSAGRRQPLIAAGVTLSVVGAVSAIVLRTTPELVAARFDRLVAPDAPIAGILPQLTDGLAGLLGRTGGLSLALLALGVPLVVAGALSGAGSPRRADRATHG